MTRRESIQKPFYYISSGGKRKMYTLRVVQYRVDPNGHLDQDDEYVRNLSTDWITAVEIAREIEPRIQAESFPITAPGKLDTVKFDGGKHAHESLAHVLKTDPLYLLWLLETKSDQAAYEKYLEPIKPYRQMLTHHRYVTASARVLEVLGDIGSKVSISGTIIRQTQKDGEFGPYHALEIEAGAYIYEVNISYKTVNAIPSEKISLAATISYINERTTPKRVRVKQPRDITFS
jgi:hypothetical protein